MNFGKFVEELKRRNVFKVATAYAIAGWIIIQVTDTVFPRLGFPDWTITLIIIMVLIGLPISLIIAWAFELTPDGLQKSDEVDITESVTSSTGKKLNGIIIASLGVLVVLLLSERIFFAESTLLDRDTLNVETASIAVLPFVNMSDDQSNEYFSDGLSEELLNGLAKLEGLQVAGRTSSFQYKGSNPDLRDVGTALGVKHILEGSVRKAGNRVRVTAQLIQAEDGFHLWSETYDRELSATEVFDIQEEITRKVVVELKVRLLPEEEENIALVLTQDIEAYNAYLEANQLLTTRQADDIELAIDRFKEAIRIDPTFAKAHSRLAFAYYLLWSNGNFPLEEAKELVRDYGEKALFLDGNDGDAYRALGSYYTSFEVNYEKAENALLRATELMPNNAMAKNSLVVLYGTTGELVKRDSLIQVAYRIDPLNNVLSSNYSGYLVREERWEEALDILNAIIERAPSYSPAYTRFASIQSNPPYGNLDIAFQYIFEAYKTNRDDINFIAALYDYSMDLDAPQLADFFSNQWLGLYPDNLASQSLRLNLAFNKQDYQTAYDKLQELKQRGSDLEEVYHQSESNLLFRLGELNQAIELLEKYNPDLLTPEYTYTEQDIGAAFQYAAFVREAGRLDDFDMLVSRVCEFSEADAAEKRSEGKEIAAFFSSINCDVFSDDPQPVIDAIDHMYFELGTKTGWPSFTTTNGFLFKEMIEDEGFIALFDRIYADLGEMRGNVYQYLKDEGEWKDEWDVEIKN